MLKCMLARQLGLREGGGGQSRGDGIAGGQGRLIQVTVMR